MRNWGIITWIFVLILVGLFIAHYTAVSSLTSTGSKAFGSTVKALSGVANGKG